MTRGTSLAMAPSPLARPLTLALEVAVARAPDDSGNITGVGISALDDRIPTYGGCVAVYSVSPAVYSSVT